MAVLEFSCKIVLKYFFLVLISVIEAPKNVKSTYIAPPENTIQPTEAFHYDPSEDFTKPHQKPNEYNIESHNSNSILGTVYDIVDSNKNLPKLDNNKKSHQFPPGSMTASNANIGIGNLLNWNIMVIILTATFLLVKILD